LVTAAAEPRARLTPASFAARRLSLPAVLVILLAAAFLRLFRLDELPPGMFSDMATNGLDIRDVFAGHLQIFFPANNGREALFIYLQALLVAGGGFHPFTFNVAAVITGMLTVALAYRLFRSLFGLQAGLIACGLTASLFLTVALSRIGLRAVSVPAFLMATIYLLWRLLRTGRARYAWAGGLLLGACLYTYIGARLVPPLVVLLCLADARVALKRRRELALFALVALAVFAPEGVYFYQHRAELLSRTAQVSVFNPNPDVRGADAYDTPAQSFLKTAGVFFVRGGQDARAQIPGRPVFGPLLGGLFALGVAVSLWLARGDVRSRWLLLWLAVMALPSALSQESPDVFRAFGAMPAAIGLAAVGACWLGRAFRQPWLTNGVGAIAVLLTFAGTFSLYFGDWSRDPRVYDIYNGGVTKLASFLDGRPERRLFLAYHLRWPVELLAPRTTQAQWYADDVSAIALPAEPQDALYVAAPAAVWSRILQPQLPGLRELPHPTDPRGAPDYLGFTWPAEAQRHLLAAQQPLAADFAPDLRLASAGVAQRQGGVAITLIWQPLRLSGPYDLYIHLLDASGRQVAQSDLLARPVEDGSTIGYLLLTQHPLDAPPGSYTAEIGAAHRSTEHPDQVIGGAIGQTARLPVQIGP
jgi:4-amino-4-deoxy-L-arabinose transferase-like glycosyltransferase